MLGLVARKIPISASRIARSPWDLLAIRFNRTAVPCHPAVRLAELTGAARTKLATATRRLRCQSDIANLPPSAVCMQIAADPVEQPSLARPVWPQNPQMLTGADVEIHLMQKAGRAEGVGQPLGLHQCGLHRLRVVLCGLKRCGLNNVLTVLSTVFRSYVHFSRLTGCSSKIGMFGCGPVAMSIGPISASRLLAFKASGLAVRSSGLSDVSGCPAPRPRSHRHSACVHGRLVSFSHASTMSWRFRRSGPL